MAAELKILITAQNQAKSVLGDLRGDLENTHGIAGKLGTGLKVGLAAGAVAATAAIAGLGAILASSAKAASEAEDIQAQLNAVLKSTEGVAGMTADAINKMALDLSKVTKFEDDAIVASSALLLTFTKIGKEVFPDAQKAILNVAQAMKMDLQSATMLVGKALNDPVKGMNAMKKAGIQFTEEQINTVKALTDVGDAAGAQRIILKELETQFGGSAVAAGKTLSGQLEILKNQFGNVKEAIGGALIPILTNLAKAIGPKLVAGFEKFAGWLTKAITAVEATATWFLHLIRTGEDLDELFRAIPASMQPFVGLLTNLYDAAMRVVDAFKAGGIGGAIKQVGSEIGAVMAASIRAGLTKALGEEKATQLFAGIKTALVQLETIFKPTFDRIKKAVAGFGEAMGKLKPSFDRLKDAIKGLEGPASAIGKVFAALGVVIGKLAGEGLAQFFERLPAIIGTAVDMLTAAVTAFATIFGTLGSLVKNVFAGDFAAAFADGKSIVATFASYFAEQIGNLTAIADQVMGGVYDAIVNTINDLTGATLPSWDALKASIVGVFEDIKAKLAPIGEALKPLADVLSKVFADISAAASKFVQSLGPVAEKLGPIKDALGELFTTLAPLGSLFAKVAGFIGEALAVIGTVIATVFGEAFAAILRNAGTVLGGFASVVLGIIETITGLFQGISAIVKAVFEGDFSGAAEAGKRAFMNLKDGLIGITDGLSNIILGFFGTMYDGITGVLNKIPGVNLKTWEEVSGGFKFGASEISASSTAIAGTVSTLSTGIATSLSSVSPAVTEAGSSFSGYKAAIDASMTDAANLTATNTERMVSSWATVAPAVQGAADAFGTIPAAANAAKTSTVPSVSSLISNIAEKFNTLKLQSAAPANAFDTVTIAAAGTATAVKADLSPTLTTLSGTDLPALSAAASTVSQTWFDTLHTTLVNTWTFITTSLVPSIQSIANTINGALIGALGAALAPISGMVTAMTGITTEANNATTAVLALIAAINSIPAIPNVPMGGGRALGGPVRAGVPYTVGERGPELFVPATNGRIVAGGGQYVTINVTGNTFSKREDIDYMLRQLDRKLRLEGGILPI